jgi:hypothetical protein
MRARTTLGDLHRATPWVWLNCEKCPHHAPLACAVAVIRWGRWRIERLAAPAGALHALRQQGRDHPASGLGRHAGGLAARQ